MNLDNLSDDDIKEYLAEIEAERQINFDKENPIQL